MGSSKNSSLEIFGIRYLIEKIKDVKTAQWAEICYKIIILINYFVFTKKKDLLII